MAKVTAKVIGSGGIGLALLPHLCRVLNYGSTVYQFDFAELTLVDGDSYEERNRDRQQFSNIGNKAEVTVENLKKEFENVDFFSKSFYITKDNIGDVIVENDLVFSCVDNHATRKLISQHCRGLKNVTVISGGNNMIDGNVQVYIRQDGQDLTLPLDSDFHKEIQNPNDENPAYIERKEGCDALANTAPQLLIANVNAATGMLNAFHSFLLGELGKYDETCFDIGLNAFRTKNLRALKRIEPVASQTEPTKQKPSEPEPTKSPAKAKVKAKAKAKSKK